MSSSSPAKIKLRTVADVIARLLWSAEHEHEVSSIILGYDDRLHGPLEKSLQDYKPIKDGGDIPEHRIWYVRTALSTTSNVDKDSSSAIDKSVLWDKLGRVDRVFLSGNGGDCPISPETLNHVSLAITNMARLDQEKQERRAAKEKQRAAKARKRAAKAAAITHLASKNESIITTKRVLRYEWTPTPWYVYSQDTDEWNKGCRDESLLVIEGGTSPPSRCELTVVTWNVLFDLYDNELQDHDERWTLIGNILERTNVDIIALQEVTPSFVKLLLSQSWVKQHYAATASPSHTATVTSSGNLILWRKSLLVPLDGGVFVCVDSFRQCSIMACLEQYGQGDSEERPVLLITNVHLLANKANCSQSSGSRALARKRELAAVIGQLQNMEQQVLRAGRQAQPMIVGDFNTSDTDDPVFTNNGSFVDVWPTLEPDQSGYTFDPTTNFRAARTRSLTDSDGGAKRLDRMYLASRQAKSPVEDGLLLYPVSIALVGVDDSLAGQVPPSDHYGLMASFHFGQKRSEHHPKASLRYSSFNAWAANANSSPDTLLALVLDNSHVLGPDLFNETSTLPVPHITLLHGFVELSTSGFRELAIQAIRDTLDSVHGTNEERSLLFSESSLDVFEHRGSATLVARPDIKHPARNWLMRLYKALRSRFQQCHEQESRFSEGWVPHISLGTFGTAFAARAEASRRINDGRWIQEETSVPVYGITMFERSPADGMFYAVVAVPFERGTSIESNVAMESALQDACTSLSRSFKGTCSGVLWEIQRACQAAVCENDSTRTRLSVYGSHAMDAALPQLSDIDAVIEVTGKNKTVAPLSSDESAIILLGDIATCIKSRYETAKCRVRTATVAGGVTLPILTVKLWNSVPMVDLVLCTRFDDGRPTDERSKIALLGMEGTERLHEELQRACPQLEPAIIERIFAGALRIIKLWAFRRGAYGASTGFLGGGAWAVLLAHSLIQGIQDSTLEFPPSSKETIPQASCRLVGYFFESGGLWSLPLAIGLTNEEVEVSTIRPMKILSNSATDDLARSTTLSTALAILSELQRAAALVTPMKEIELSAVLERLSPSDFLSIFETFLLIHVTVPEDKASDFVVADVKAWACRQLLYLTGKLEHVVADASSIRPRPTALRATKNSSKSFLWFIGIQAPLSQELFDFVETKLPTMQQDWTSTFPLATSHESMPTLELKNALDVVEHLSCLGVSVQSH